MAHAQLRACLVVVACQTLHGLTCPQQPTLHTRLPSAQTLVFVTAALASATALMGSPATPASAVRAGCAHNTISLQHSLIVVVYYSPFFCSYLSQRLFRARQVCQFDSDGCRGQRHASAALDYVWK